MHSLPSDSDSAPDSSGPSNIVGSFFGAAAYAFLKELGRDSYSWVKSLFTSSESGEAPIFTKRNHKNKNVKSRETILGVVCESTLFVSGNGSIEIVDLHFYCPDCDTELVCIPREVDHEAEFWRRPRYSIKRKNPEDTKLICEECDRVIYRYDGYYDSMIRRFADQIARLLRKNNEAN